jgi:hypothetical protein
VPVSVVYKIQVETSVNAMLTNNEAPMDVIELDKKAKKKGYVNSGTLIAKSVSIEHRPTFTDVRTVFAVHFVCVRVCVKNSADVQRTV